MGQAHEPTAAYMLADIKRMMEEFSDPETRLDLAIAYAEMGLVNDAIEELEIVLRVSPNLDGVRALLEELRARLPGSEPPPPIG